MPASGMVAACSKVRLVPAWVRGTPRDGDVLVEGALLRRSRDFVSDVELADAGADGLDLARDCHAEDGVSSACGGRRRRAGDM